MFLFFSQYFSFTSATIPLNLISRGTTEKAHFSGLRAAISGEQRNLLRFFFFMFKQPDNNMKFETKNKKILSNSIVDKENTHKKKKTINIDKITSHIM